MKEPRRSAQLDSWRRSAEFSEIARRQCLEMNERRWEGGPRCGATRKSDREPCQSAAMENGRCRVHGGKTPKGDNWHVRQWPDKAAPRAMDKLARKLNDQAKAARKLAKRLDAMTPEERERYDSWHRARKPGSAIARQNAREERRQNAEFRKRCASVQPPMSSEAQKIADEIASLRQLLADRQKDKGVFS